MGESKPFGVVISPGMKSQRYIGSAPNGGLRVYEERPASESRPCKGPSR
jgi:hypothetical protein